ncbi:aldo/keto reductase [Sphingomonas soli]|uniref:aldo/keto reductase n=1 Tax=Sphingomonas soli TaxID=266127 RepID=UPI00082B5F86|nr:aldo/keto reductase [Sphingomonas soli]
MEQVRLGRSELSVPPLILGTATFGDPSAAAWNMGGEAVWPLIRHAYDKGINSFDTGATYGRGLAEARLGDALARLGKRDQVTVTTKVYFPTGDGPEDRGLSRKHMLSSLDTSLRRLRTDYVDVLMIHRWDAETPIEETLEALDEIVRSGRARHIGASSMSAWRMMKALGMQRAGGLASFVVMQGLYNLLYREEEREMIPLCEEEGVGYTAWSPLARGYLAGPQADATRLTHDRFASERFEAELDAPVLATLDEVVAETGLSHATVALAWLRARGAVSVIGATSPEQIDVALAAVQTKLDEATVGRLEAQYRPHPVAGFNPREERAAV